MPGLKAATTRMSYQNPMCMVLVGGSGCVSPDAAPLYWPCQKPRRAGEIMRAYTAAVGAVASPSSSPRFLARNADTLARFMHRSEQ